MLDTSEGYLLTEDDKLFWQTTYAYMAMHSPNYTFRDGQEPIAYHRWNSDDESSYVLCSGCAQSPQECEFPLYDDDLKAMAYEEVTACDKCNKELAPAIERRTNTGASPETTE